MYIYKIIEFQCYLEILYKYVFHLFEKCYFYIMKTIILNQIKPQNMVWFGFVSIFFKLFKIVWSKNSPKIFQIKLYYP